MTRTTIISPEALRKKTLALTVQHPLAAYPSMIGAMAGVYSAAFGFSLLSTGILTAGLLVGVGGWAFEFFGKGDAYSLAILKKQREALQKQRRDENLRLEKELLAMDHTEATQQLKNLHAKFSSFENILAKKLQAQELSYNRYLSIAEQVYLNALDNLDHLATALQSISAIDVKDLRDRLANLPTSSAELPALETRWQLWIKQQERAKALLLENEFAMTQLDMVATKLADITTKSGQAQMDMDFAMSELRDLIEKSNRYAIK